MRLSTNIKAVLTVSIYLTLLYILLTYYLGVMGYVKFYVISFLIIPYGYLFTITLSISLLLLYSLLTMITLPDVRKFKSVETQISSFLSDVSAYLKSGSTLYQAVILAKHSLRGYFKELIEKLDTMVNLGISFDDAVNMVVKDMGHEYSYVLRTLSVAMKSGGKSVDVVERASNILDYIHRYRDYRRKVFKQYLVLLLMIVVVYDFTVAFVILILNHLIAIEALFLIKPDVELMYTLLYYTSIVVSLMSGISYGKSIEGSATRALPYVLMISTLNFTLIHMLPTLITVLLGSHPPYLLFK